MEPIQLPTFSDVGLSSASASNQPSGSQFFAAMQLLHSVDAQFSLVVVVIGVVTAATAAASPPSRPAIPRHLDPHVSPSHLPRRTSATCLLYLAENLNGPAAGDLTTRPLNRSSCRNRASCHRALVYVRKSVEGALAVTTPCHQREIVSRDSEVTDHEKHFNCRFVPCGLYNIAL